MALASIPQPPSMAQPDSIDHGTLAKVITGGDLSSLNDKQKTDYYMAVCNACGVNPATRPFEFIKLNGKLTLYARKDCTEQLRKNQSVSVTSLTHKIEGGVCAVTVSGVNYQGRTDFATGVVAVEGVKGDNLANAIMKAETKAKRRLTLSICGLGMLDETELETIPSAERVPTDAPKSNAVDDLKNRLRNENGGTGQCVEASMLLDEPVAPTAKDITEALKVRGFGKSDISLAVPAYIKKTFNKSKFDELTSDQKLSLLAAINGAHLDELKLETADA